MLFKQEHDDVGLVFQCKAEESLRLMDTGTPRRNNCRAGGTGLFGRINDPVGFYQP